MSNHKIKYCQSTHGNMVCLAGTWILVGPAMTSLVLWQQVARAIHPPTLNPCMVEGECRPNRATWGWNQTRWRPWPGDQAGLQPSPTAIPAADQAEEPFEPFERPSAEQEDQRGNPPKREEDAEPTAPADESIPGLPSVELEGRATPQQLPVIEEVVLQLPAARDVELRQTAESSHISYGVECESPMGGRLAPPQQALVGAYEQAPAGIPPSIQEIQPSEPLSPAAGNRSASAEESPADRLQEDAPPRLPASLRRQATRLRGLPARKTPKQTRTNSGSTRKQRLPTGGVVPATWQQSMGIQSTGFQLINPAATVSAGADGDELKQAIYYEATE